VEINRVKAQCSFEVFDSAGSWGFLLGKPMLKAFKAIHNYTSDTVKISDNLCSATILNQIAHPTDLEHTKQGISLMLDIKQRGMSMGGTEKPPSRQVTRNGSHTNEESTNTTPEYQKNPLWQPMGQWTATHVSQQSRERKREQQLWR
jgi:hypothetical protein